MSPKSTDVYWHPRGSRPTTINYCLPPREALVACHEQFDKGNYCSWEYTKSLGGRAPEAYNITRSGDYLRLGNCKVYCPKGENDNAL